MSAASLALAALLVAGPPGGVHFERTFDEAMKKARAQRKAVMIGVELTDMVLSPGVFWRHK